MNQSQINDIIERAALLLYRDMRRKVDRAKGSKRVREIDRLEENMGDGQRREQRLHMFFSASANRRQRYIEKVAGISAALEVNRFLRKSGLTAEGFERQLADLGDEIAKSL